MIDKRVRYVKPGEPITTMSVKDFRRLGFLQEINRLILHPCGLALSVIIDEKTGEESFGEIWETDDAEGIYYDIANSSDERKAQFSDKLQSVKAFHHKTKRVRMKELGFHIEPIPNTESDNESNNSRKST